MQNWFETWVKYKKQTDEGKLKTVTERFLVDAVSFTDAEARITEIKHQEITGEFYVTKITKTNFNEVIDHKDSEQFFKAKINYKGIDDVSQTPKVITEMILVGAESINEAFFRVEAHLEQMTVPYKIPCVTESKVLEVYPFESKL